MKQRRVLSVPTATWLCTKQKCPYVKLHGSILRPTIIYVGRKINSICTDGTCKVPLKVDRYDKIAVQN